MIVKVLLVAEMEIPDIANPDGEVQRRLDAFREAVRPASEYGITIFRAPEMLDRGEYL